MTYNAKHRNIIGTLGFFVLGMLFGGVASAIVVWREYRQYKKSGRLEYHDVWRYIIASSCGAVIQFLVVLTLLLTKKF